MRFKKIPLFGPDSSPLNTSRFLSLCATAFFWLVFFVCMIFIRPTPQKPKFKEIKIVLSPENSAQKEKKSEEKAQKSSEIEKSDMQEVSQNLQPQQEVNEIQKEIEPQKIEAAPIVNQENKTAINTDSAKKTALPTESKKVEQKKEVPQKSEQKKTELLKKDVQKNEVSKAVAPKTETKKTETQKKEAPVATEVPVVLSKSVEELMAEQMNSKKKKNDFDWDAMFGESDSLNEDKTASSAWNEDFFEDKTEENHSGKTQTQNQSNFEESSFSGSAGSATTETPKSVKSESSKKQTSSQAALSSTTSDLNRISTATFKGGIKNGVSDEIQVQTESIGDGRVRIKMSNGSSRSLLEPAKPEITLSQNAASTIDGSRTVKIRFKVIESGNVTRSEISITPASMLSDSVKNEIIEQISRWRFEAADYIAFAEFDYKIEQR